jgi:YHS domain-containing protein
MFRFTCGFALLLPLGMFAGEPAAKTAPKQALQPFNDLIGSWKGTGVPEGTRDEKQNGFWQETIIWRWQFKGDDAWLIAEFQKGKYFSEGELRAGEKPNQFKLLIETNDKQKLTFEGELQDRKLTLERVDDKTKDTQRLTIRLLHSNRIVYVFDVKPAGKTLFAKKYQVGATKEGEAFATVDDGPECVVSGGKGTMAVTFQGKTYYVCCTGCRDEFKANPEKYIKEYEKKKKAKK